MKKVLFGLSLVGLLAMGSCKKAKDAANSAADATTEAVSDGANAVGDAAGSAVDATGNAVDAAGDAANSAVGQVAEAVSNLGITMPTFKTPEGVNWADSLVEAASEVKNAATSGDMEGLNAANTTFTNIATEQIKKLQGTEDFSTATAFAQEMIQKVSSF